MAAATTAAAATTGTATAATTGTATAAALVRPESLPAVEDIADH